MRSSQTIHVVSAHAEGEVGDVIVGGVAPPPGKTLWEQRDFIARDGRLRNFILNEPRGGVFRHVNLLVPPVNPEANMGFIIMEPEDTPPMSGSNAICTATVILDCGIIPMTEPITDLVLEAPGGLVPIRADCRNGKAERITVRNLPSFACSIGSRLDVPGLGRLDVDTAFGGDSFVIVNASSLGFGLVPEEAAQLAETGMRIVSAANRDLGFSHPELPQWTTISFCLFASPPQRRNGSLYARSAVVVRPGKIDRSPTGTAVSARMALLHAQGIMKVGDSLTATSIIDSTFVGRIADVTDVAGKAAIVPEISGRAWITGIHQHLLDPSDPWPEGYRLNDTWGRGVLP